MKTPFRNMTIDAYLDALGSASPTPGGGGTAALLAAEACALAEMAARITAANPNVGEFRDKAIEYTRLFPMARSIFLDLIDEDALHFHNLMELWRTSPSDEKDIAMQAAFKKAAEAPIQTAQTMSDLLPSLTELLLRGNPHVISDSVMAAQLAVTAIHSAILNIKMNTKHIRDEFFNREQEEAEQQWESSISAINAALTYQVHI